MQTAEETLTLGSGSCRDSAWLLVQVLRRLGMAARFVSGYLVQLVPDVKPLDGPAGAAADFTDLHAWTEVYFPGAGWVGLDPTSGLLAGEGHIPLACSPDPASAAPITGGVENCETKFTFDMTISRIHEDPRVTSPTATSSGPRSNRWAMLLTTPDGGGRAFDDGGRADVRLDRRHGRRRMEHGGRRPDEAKALRAWCADCGDNSRPEALLHFGQGKWYPGESLPRWALACYWRHRWQARVAQSKADCRRRTKKRQ